MCETLLTLWTFPIFAFFSESAEWNSTKLSRNVRHLLGIKNSSLPLGQIMRSDWSNFKRSSHQQSPNFAICKPDCYVVLYLIY